MLNADFVAAISGLANRIPTLVTDADGRQHLVTSVGTEVQPITPLDPITPEKIVASVVLNEADSFCLYVADFKDETRTVIFVTPPSSGGSGAAGPNVMFSAIIDYHSTDGPGLCAHRVDFPVRWSVEWTRWMNAASKPMTHVDFAEFLEEYHADIREPAGAEILELVNNFQMRRSVVYDGSIRLRDGSQSLTFKDETADGGGKHSVVLPPKLVLGIPVFFGEEPYRVEVWLRHRLSEGKVLFSVKFAQPERIVDDAFKLLVNKVSGSTKIGALIGAYTTKR